MRITIHDDLSGLEARLGDAALSRATAALTQQVLSDSNIHCKRDTDQTMLSGAANTVATRGEVTWTTPYAAKAYYDPNTRTQKNHYATPEWFEKAKGEHLGDWERVVAEALS